MAFYLSPVVDVNEIDLTTTIPAVATSVAVIALRETWKGPELKQRLITNSDDLVDVFGEPTTRANCYKDMISAMGYLKYGNKLYCTRVMPVNSTFAGFYGSFNPSGSSFSAYTENDAYILTDIDSRDPDDFADVVSFTAGVEVDSDMAFISVYRGVCGNHIKVAVVGRDTYTAALTASSISGVSTALYNDIVEIDAPLDTNDKFLVIVKVAEQKEDATDDSTFNIVETFVVSTKTRAIDDEGKNIYCENVINSESNYIRMAIKSTLKEQNVNSYFFSDYVTFGGGQDSSDDYVTDIVVASDVIAAYNLYSNPEEIDVNIFIDSDKSITVKQELIEICSARKDSIAIIDCLSADVINNDGEEATSLRTYRRVTFNENTSYAAFYGNWLEVYDKWNAKYRWVPPSGFMAGIFANTDDVSDPWFAPAGLNRAILTNVRRLAWNPTLGERDILYKNGINPIVSFAGQGKVVWGQKTMLDKSSAFNRINVRRLFMILEKALSTALKYFLFEPNDEFTRLLIVNMIEPFLRDVKARRGIYDFMIVCDERNNTPERIDRNELWVDCYIKPTRAAEFIVLNMIATKTGASFTELVASGQ
jgi:hypothetical protein